MAEVYKAESGEVPNAEVPLFSPCWFMGSLTFPALMCGILMYGKEHCQIGMLTWALAEFLLGLHHICMTDWLIAYMIDRSFHSLSKTLKKIPTFLPIVHQDLLQTAGNVCHKSQGTEWSPFPIPSSLVWKVWLLGDEVHDSLSSLPQERCCKPYLLQRRS